MRLLLDTHALIWALFDDPRLGDKARALIENMDNQIFYSAASVWEIQIKHDKNPDRIFFDGRDVIRYCDDAGLISLNINSFHTIDVGSLNVKDGCIVNNDPFDRLLIAQAKSENMRLLTHDKIMQYYDEPCILMF